MDEVGGATWLGLAALPRARRVAPRREARELLLPITRSIYTTLLYVFMI